MSHEEMSKKSRSVQVRWQDSQHEGIHHMMQQAAHASHCAADMMRASKVVAGSSSETRLGLLAIVERSQTCCVQSVTCCKPTAKRDHEG
jgi:hypothetical protein